MRLVPVIALLAGGCFYTEPINQRPSIDIRNETTGVIHRADSVTLSAVVSDPENQVVDLAWTAYACRDVAAASCATVFQTGTQATFTFAVPSLSLGENVRAVRVTLAAVDVLGAHAHPDQELVIPLADYDPTLALAASSRYGFTDGTDVDVFAQLADADDDTTMEHITWDVFPPSVSATYETQVTLIASPDHTKRTEHFVLRHPTGVGTWTVRATASDPLGHQVTADQTIVIAADRDPCLAQWTPIAPLDGTAALPLSAPTRFAVPVVTDDLDVYPTVPGDPVLGTTTFQWSIEKPGAGAFVPLATTGNAVELSPDVFDHGDLVQLRVEIFDRRAVAIPCAADALTCSISSTSCLQRLTWRVSIP